MRKVNRHKGAGRHSRYPLTHPKMMQYITALFAEAEPQFRDLYTNHPKIEVCSTIGEYLYVANEILHTNPGKVIPMQVPPKPDYTDVTAMINEYNNRRKI